MEEVTTIRHNQFYEKSPSDTIITCGQNSLRTQLIWPIFSPTDVIQLLHRGVSWNSPLHDTMYVVDGLVLPKFIEQEDLDKLKDLSLRDDDAWMYSDLPQGRYHMDTVQYMVHLIHNEGKDNGKKINDAVPWMETGTGDSPVTAEDLTPPRAFKTYIPYERMPCGLPNSTPCKYIYIARNPKDVDVDCHVVWT